MDSLELSKKLIKIDTSTSTGNTLKLAKYIQDLLSSKGFSCKLLKKGKQANLIATYGTNPELIFSGHLDTVDPDLNEWNTDPWKPTIKNGKLYGLGSNDMKGPLACILTSVLNNKEKMKKGCKFIFTYAEEIGLKGIKSLPKKYFKGRYCIVCEPTNLYPVIAHNGLIRCRVVVYGKSAHGSTPWKGVNALYHIMLLQNQIMKLNKELSNRKSSILGKIIYNLGILKGGRAANIVPSKAEMEFDFRTIPELKNKMLLNKIKSLVNSYCKRNNLKYSISQDSVSPPFFEDKNSKFASEIRSICKKKFLFFHGTTEAPVFQSNNLKTIVLGPAKGMEHKANEYIEISQLKKGEKIYEKIINRFCYI